MLAAFETFCGKESNNRLMIKFILDKAIDSIRLHHLIQIILSLAAKKSILIYNNFFLLFSLFSFFLFFLPFLFSFFPYSAGGGGHSHLSGGHGPLVPPLATGLLPSFTRYTNILHSCPQYIYSSFQALKIMCTDAMWPVPLYFIQPRICS